MSEVRVFAYAWKPEKTGQWLIEAYATLEAAEKNAECDKELGYLTSKPFEVRITVPDATAEVVP